MDLLQERKNYKTITLGSCSRCGKDLTGDTYNSDLDTIKENILCDDCFMKLYRTKVEITAIPKESTMYVIGKRVIDILGGIVGCIFALIFMVIIKVAYVLDGDHDPIIFIQERIGKDGKMIRIYKFRSMVPNAEEILSQLMKTDPKIRYEYMTNKKLENDPRVTRLGNVIRRKSIDEFPQFFNVLLGNMSLVGPRPYLFREIGDMGQAYNDIIEVKPGITGPWQTGGRSDISFNARCRKDVEYVKNHSLLGDIQMILLTVIQAAGGKGAK